WRARTAATARARGACCAAGAERRRGRGGPHHDQRTCPRPAPAREAAHGPSCAPAMRHPRRLTPVPVIAFVLAVLAGASTFAASPAFPWAALARLQAASGGWL